MAYKEFGATIAPSNVSSTGFPIAMGTHIGGGRIVNDKTTLKHWCLLGEGATLNDQKANAIGQIWYDTLDNKYWKLNSWASTNPVWVDVSTIFATRSYVDDAIENIPDPMIFKGSLGTEGTITSLPTASTSNTGFTYKVITAGTYAGQVAKIGDTFISDGTIWNLIPSGDEPTGTVTSITLNATSPILIDDSNAITTSGTRTFSHASTSGNKHIPSGGSADNYLKWDSDGTATWSPLALPAASTSVAGITTVGTSGGAASYVHTHVKSDITDFAHNHDTVYLGLTAKAADSDKLDGYDLSYFKKGVGKGSYYKDVVNISYHGTATEILIKTKIPFLSSSQMPLIHLEGYAYGDASPIELRIAFYIYNSSFVTLGCTSTCPWDPTIKLFTYIDNSTTYVGIALIKPIYFPQCTINYIDVWGAGSGVQERNYSENWTIEYNTDINTSIVPTDNLATVPYRPIANSITGNAATATNSDKLDGKDSTDFSLVGHGHGNITDGGAIGTTSGLMVKTTTSGVLTTLPAGSSGQFLQYDGTWATPTTTYSLPLASDGTRGGIQIGYTATEANLPLKLDSEKGYITLTSSSINTALGYTPIAEAVTSVSTGLGLTGGPITTTGTIELDEEYGDSVNPYGSKTGKFVLAAPNAGDGVPSFRALVASDIPTLNQNTTGSAGSVINSIKFDDDGVGSDSGTTYDGSTAFTISYNTIGAAASSHTHDYSNLTNLPDIYNPNHIEVPDSNFDNLFGHKNDIWVCKPDMLNGPLNNTGNINYNSNSDFSNCVIQQYGSTFKIQVLYITTNSVNNLLFGNIFYRMEGDKWTRFSNYYDIDNLTTTVNNKQNKMTEAVGSPFTTSGTSLIDRELIVPVPNVVKAYNNNSLNTQYYKIDDYINSLEEAIIIINDDSTLDYNLSTKFNITVNSSYKLSGPFTPNVDFTGPMILTIWRGTILSTLRS